MNSWRLPREPPPLGSDLHLLWLARHVDALVVRPTGSLWDYVPEPRRQTARPLINDAHSMNMGVADSADAGHDDHAHVQPQQVREVNAEAEEEG